MSIWLQNFASIQPRTSLEKSDVSWPTAMTVMPPRRGLRPSEGGAHARKHAAGEGGMACCGKIDIEPRYWAGIRDTLEGSFSAGSTATIATKYSFFQVFRDLQNYLAKFSKILQNFAKNQRFSQKSTLFLRKSGKFAKFCIFFHNFARFCEISGFFQKTCWFLRKSLLFCKILQNSWKFSQIVL